MHLRHIDPRSSDWKDAMIDDTRPEVEPEIEAASTESGHALAPPALDQRDVARALSAPSR
jgi:hypothetical protein